MSRHRVAALASLGTGRTNTAQRAPSEPLVVDATLPQGALARLTAALDEPGTDLRNAVTVFADSLADAVPSLLGVTVTLVLNGLAVTLNLRVADLQVTSKTSLNVPFSALVPDVKGSTMIFYAIGVGAFADLAAVVTRSVSGDEQVPAGGHPAPLCSGWSLEVSGLAEFSTFNQAVGVLIDQGYTPDEARLELHLRAARYGETVDDTAQHTLDHLINATDRKVVARAMPPGTRLPAQRSRTKAAPGAELTARERDVLRLLIAEVGTVGIATALLVLPGTVDDHIRSIMTKFGADSRVETVAFSLRNNVLGTR